MSGGMSAEARAALRSWCPLDAATGPEPSVAEMVAALEGELAPASPEDRQLVAEAATALRAGRRIDRVDASIIYEVHRQALVRRHWPDAADPTCLAWFRDEDGGFVLTDTCPDRAHAARVEGSA